MTKPMTAVLADALRLDDDARAELAAELLASLDGGSTPHRARRARSVKRFNSPLLPRNRRPPFAGMKVDGLDSVPSSMTQWSALLSGSKRSPTSWRRALPAFRIAKCQSRVSRTRLRIESESMTSTLWPSPILIVGLATGGIVADRAANVCGSPVAASCPRG